MMIWLAFGVVLAAYVAIEWVYRQYWGAKLTVEARLPEENLHEGETANITEIIINDKFLPLPVLETFFELDRGLRYTSGENASVSDKQYRRDVFTVGMKRKISRTFEITCAKRGYYTLDKLELMSSDLFLNQKFLAKRSLNSTLHVYPRKVRSDKIALPYQRIMGELLVQKKLQSDPFSFGGMRDYTSADPMNTINWGASAKAQNLIVNIYDSSIDQTVVILLDTAEQDGSFYEALNEESICIAAALAERLLLQGVEVSVLGNAQDVCSGERLCLQRVKGQSVVLLKEHFARLSLGKEAPITTLFAELPADTFVVLISKNQELQHTIQTSLQDFIWVLPYRGEAPDLQGLAGQSLLWEYKSGNL